MRLDSRMDSAISLGVFCRAAPSTRAIIRSRKVSPGSAVIRTTMRSDSTRGAAGDGAAVAAGLADDRGRLAGDRRLVDAGDALDDVAVARDHLAGLDDDEVADLQVAAGPRCSWPPRSSRAVVCVLRRCAGARPAPCPGPRRRPRRGSRTARWAHSQSAIEISEQAAGRATASSGGEHGADLDDEHHRVPHQRARVELAHRLRQRPARAVPGRTSRTTGPAVRSVCGDAR